MPLQPKNQAKNKAKNQPKIQLKERPAQRKRRRKAAAHARLDPALQSMLDQIDQGVGLFDAQSRMHASNGRFRDMLGITEAFSATAPTYTDLIAHLAERGDFGDITPQAAIREFAGSAAEPSLDERMLPDGRVLECRRTPLAEGGFVLVYTDVTERRHAEFLVEDSERRLRTILDKAPVALAVIAQEDGEIKQINGRFRQLFAIEGSGLPASLGIRRFVDDAHLHNVLSAASNTHTDFEAELRRADGTTFWALVSSIRFVFEWAPAILTSFHDITDRRRAEAGLQEELGRKRVELGEARVLQLELSPPNARSPAGIYEAQIDVVLEPAKEVGGDLVDYFHVDDDLLVLLLGDVSHKGASAALFMARTHSLVRSLAARPDARALFSQPEQAMRLINAALSRNNALCMFVTLVLAAFDGATGKLTFVRAGHLPPLLRRATGQIERLDALGGPPAGLLDTAIHKPTTVQMRPGDQLLLITDGVTEAATASGALFGESRLTQWFAGLEPDALEPLKGLTAAVRTFEAGEPPADDVAALRLAIFAQR